MQETTRHIPTCREIRQPDKKFAYISLISASKFQSKKEVLAPARVKQFSNKGRADLVLECVLSRIPFDGGSPAGVSTSADSAGLCIR